MGAGRSIGGKNYLITFAGKRLVFWNNKDSIYTNKQVKI